MQFFQPAWKKLIFDFFHVEDMQDEWVDWEENAENI